ncbi:hypothetical protein GCM10022209_31120 [Chitinophaga oryziterrae]
MGRKDGPPGRHNSVNSFNCSTNAKPITLYLHFIIIHVDQLSKACIKKKYKLVGIVHLSKFKHLYYIYYGKGPSEAEFINVTIPKLKLLLFLPILFLILNLLIYEKKSSINGIRLNWAFY